jgi:hypothetical protein
MKRLMIGLAAGALVAAMLPGAVNAGGGKPVVVGTYDSNGVQGYKVHAYVDKKTGVEGGYFEVPRWTGSESVAVRLEVADVCTDGDRAAVVSVPYLVTPNLMVDFLMFSDDRGHDEMFSGGGFASAFDCEVELAGAMPGQFYPIDKGGIVVH